MERRQQSIFGTPPEPLFNLKPYYNSSEQLQDWMDALIQENEHRLQQPILTHIQIYFKAGRSAHYVFDMCEKLRQPPEVKYYAVELFNSFMVQHVYDLFKHIKKTGRYNDWLGTLERVKNQVVLRIVTCCQIASKLTSHYKVITPRRAYRVLHEFGYRFDTENILNSELRIMKTLNYRLSLQSPLTYVETILELLGLKNCKLNIKSYHNASMKILDLVYMQRAEIYDHLFNVTADTQSDSQPNREKFSKVESDFVLLATSVIAAASFVTDQANTDKVIEQVSLIGKINSSDVLDFATVIVQILMQDNHQ